MIDDARQRLAAARPAQLDIADTGTVGDAVGVVRNGVDGDVLGFVLHAAAYGPVAHGTSDTDADTQSKLP